MLERLSIHRLSLTKCYECLNIAIKKYHNAVATKTGCCTVRLDILMENKNIVWEHFIDVFNINKLATCYLHKLTIILSMLTVNRIWL